MVAPYLVDKSDPLSGVNGVFNAIFVHGNMLGDAMFYGQGAGKEATASAVTADVIEEAQVLGRSVMSKWSAQKQTITEVSNVENRFFVRMQGDAAQAESVFGKIDLVDVKVAGECGFVTEKMTEEAYRKCAAKTDLILNRIRLREK